MPIGAKTFRAAIVCLCVQLAGGVHAEGIDTEHVFGFMIGSDVGTGAAEQESTVGAAFGLMAQVRPGIFLGGEARYLRKYGGIGLEELAGQALLIGPTAYFQLSERSRLTASWSVQAWGRQAGSNAALDLFNFERHQARLVFGVNF